MSYKKYWDIKIETLTRKEIVEYQERKLSKMLQFAYKNSAYYKESFDKEGVSPHDFKKISDISKFPFVDKQIERKRQTKKPILGDMIAVEEEEVVFVSASSGSTGVPTLSPFTKDDFDEFQNAQSRLFWAAGVRPSDRYVHALNFTLFVGGPNVIGAQNLGALCIWAGTVPSERLLFILKEFQPTAIWTTPSYAWYLGETAKKQGINPAKDLAINKIIVAGEPGGSIAATKKAIEELWDAKVIDFYGISDIFGACAGMCEVGDGLHILEDHILVETIDPHTLEVLLPGEKGELVFTTLRKKARPMIRFRTGDIGYVDYTPCQCGRTHGRIHLNGRLDDMFIVSGVNIFPSDIEYVVRGMEKLTGEYKITIFKEDFTTKFKVEVEHNQPMNQSKEELANALAQAIKTRVGVMPKEIIIHKDNTLPRETHKAKRLVDLRDIS